MIANRDTVRLDALSGHNVIVRHIINERFEGKLVNNAMKTQHPVFDLHIDAGIMVFMLELTPHITMIVCNLMFR